MTTQTTPPMPSQAAPPTPVSNAAAFTGSIPSCYDRHLGPLLFEFSAADMAERVAAPLQGPAHVLEVACGTGICTESLWRALPSGSSLVATDLNPAMLQYAQSQRGQMSNLTYRQADALNLPFDDNTFDAVVCQFGVMFFPDKVQGLAEMARVTKPGGRVLFNVWDSFEHNPVIELAHNTIVSFFESNPPRFLEVPFGDHDIDVHTGRLRGAGLCDVESSVVSVRVERPAASVARGLVEGNPGVLDLRARGGVAPQTVVEAVAGAIERSHGSSHPAFSLQEIVFTATKPARRSATGRGAQ